MESRLTARRAAAIAAAGAFVTIGALGACTSTPEPPAPTTPSTPTPASSTSAPVEKSIDPHAGNLFTPSHTAPPAPSVAPGQHHPPGVG